MAVRVLERERRRRTSGARALLEVGHFARQAQKAVRLVLRARLRLRRRAGPRCAATAAIVAVSQVGGIVLGKRAR